MTKRRFFSGIFLGSLVGVGLLVSQMGGSTGSGADQRKASGTKRSLAHGGCTASYSPLEVKNGRIRASGETTCEMFHENVCIRVILARFRTSAQRWYEGNGSTRCTGAREQQHISRTLSTQYRRGSYYVKVEHWTVDTEGTIDRYETLVSDVQKF